MEPHGSDMEEAASEFTGMDIDASEGSGSNNDEESEGQKACDQFQTELDSLLFIFQSVENRSHVLQVHIRHTSSVFTKVSLTVDW